jgi:hypothetical protein
MFFEISLQILKLIINPMSDPAQISSLENKIDNRLQRITNVLLLNASFINNIGLLNGEIRTAIFFYHYAHFFGRMKCEVYASIRF